MPFRPTVSGRVPPRSRTRMGAVRSVVGVSILVLGSSITSSRVLADACSTWKSMSVPSVLTLSD
eukprot:8145823-Alexandrium_andersonii.AAC.1